MKCFNHSQADAVGSCKFCFKGVCPQCARDAGCGIVCSAQCESEVKSIHALVERNKKLASYVPTMHSRSAIWLTMMALIFLGFGVYERQGAFAAYMILFGIVLLCGAGFALVNRRRIARM